MCIFFVYKNVEALLSLPQHFLESFLSSNTTYEDISNSFTIKLCYLSFDLTTSIPGHRRPHK